MGLEFLEKTKANIEKDRKKEKDMLIAEGESRRLCLNNCVTVYDCPVIIRDIRENSYTVKRV